MAAKAWKWVMKHEWLLVVLLLVTLMRVPTLFEPYWYGDEGIYLTIGKAVSVGRELYKDIHDNKPPLLYVMAALAAARMLIEERGAMKHVFMAGILIGLGGLFKIPAVLEAGIWPLVWWRFKDRGWFTKSAVLGVGGVLPVLISIGFY